MNLAAMIDETRIVAESEVIVRSGEQDVADIMHQRSANSDVVFLGLRDPDPWPGGGVRGESATGD